MFGKCIEHIYEEGWRIIFTMHHGQLFPKKDWLAVCADDLETSSTRAT